MVVGLFLGFSLVSSSVVITPEDAEALTAIAAQALGKDARFEVTTGPELSQALDFEAEKQRVGCDEVSCLNEIAGAMGARYIVFGTVSVLDGDLGVVDLSLFDYEQATVVGRERVEGEDIRALSQKLAPAMRALVTRVPERKTKDQLLVLTFKGGAYQEDSGLGLVTLGAGGALAAAGVIALVGGAAAAGVTALMNERSHDPTTNQITADEARNTVELVAPIADVLVAGGAVATLAGLVTVGVGGALEFSE